MEQQACAPGFVLRGWQSLGQSTKQHGEVFRPKRHTGAHVAALRSAFLAACFSARRGLHGHGLAAQMPGMK